MQALIIQGLENTDQPDAQNLADELARRWLHANYLGFQDTQMMYEKVRRDRYVVDYQTAVGSARLCRLE